MNAKIIRNSILVKSGNFLLSLLIFLNVRVSNAYSVLSLASIGNSNKLASIYWNTNNKNFYDSTNSGNNYYLKMNAQLGDSIDLVCPTLRDDYSLNDQQNFLANVPNQAHYLTIYKVGSKFEFDNCIIDQKNVESIQVLRCDKPFLTNPTKFTIFFVRFSPVPGALEFEEDKEYYFLSASSGDKSGMDFTTGGLCSQFNMRFSIKISQSLAETAQLNRSRSDPTNSQPSSVKKSDASILAPNSDEQLPGSDKQLPPATNASDMPAQPQVSKLNLISSSSQINFNAYLIFLFSFLVVFL